MSNVVEITVESTATASYAEGAITITKPTGLVENDMLVGVFGMAAGNTMTIPSGWTSLSNLTTTWGLTNLDVAMMYKVADSSDVAASNFSFDVADGTGSLCGTLFRISGVQTTDPFTTPVAGNDSNSSSSRSHTISFTPEQTQSVLICAMGCQPNSSMSVTSVSSTGSPTWTEVQDAPVGAGVFWVGHTQYSSVTEITNFSAVLNETTDRSSILLLGVRSVVTSSGTNTLLDVSPNIFSQAGSGGTTGTSALLAVSPELFSQSGQSTAPAQWANESKNSASWANESKS